MKKLILIVLLLSCSFLHAVPCPAGYGSVYLLAIQAQASLSGAVFNVPVMFAGNSVLKSTANGGLSKSSGLDIVFCDTATGGNVIPYYLAPSTYSATTGSGLWIVKANISNAAINNVYVMVGSASASDLSCGPSGANNCGTTLLANYLFLLETPPGSYSLVDVTGNNTSIVNHGATAVADNTGAGGALSLAQASTQYVDLGAANNPNPNSNGVTYGAWINAATLTQYPRVMSNFDNANGNKGYELLTGVSGSYNQAFCQTGNSTPSIGPGTTQPTFSVGTWAMLTCTTPSTGGANNTTYVNAAAGGSAPWYGDTRPAASSYNMMIGKVGYVSSTCSTTSGAQCYWNGKIAHAFAYNGQLSNDYIKAMYINQSNPAASYTFTQYSVGGNGTWIE